MKSITFEFVDQNHVKYEIMRKLESVFSERDRAKHTDDLFNKICTYAVFLIAKSEDDICGYCAFYANNEKTLIAFITLIAIKKNVQNFGIGKLLIKETMRYANRNGMRRLQLEVDKDNATALRFYLRNGFVIVDEAEQSYYMSRDII